MKIILKHWKIILIISLALASYLSFYIYKWEYRKPLLEITFFSLEKGRAIFVRTPKNKIILIGGGQNSEAIRGITRSMPFYNRKLDYVVIPSAVPAQIGGLIEIVDRYEIENIVIGKYVATSTVLSQLLRDIRKKKIHTIEVEKSDEIKIEKDIKLKILFPYGDFKFNKTSLPELGLLIEYKNTSAYLLGNLSKTIQKDIYNSFEVKSNNNIVEFYNSMGETKVHAELLEKIDAEFVFNTKEKELRVVSDGEGWGKVK